MPAAPSRRELLNAVAEKLGVPGPDNDTGPSGAYQLAKNLDLGTDGYQKARRWYKGGPIQYEDAWKLLEAIGWIKTESSPIDVAADYIRRLEEGEKIPKRERERAAVQLERLGASLPRLAERLRQEPRADRQAR